MRKPNLFLETSVFGFYYDEMEVNRYKKEATRQLFSQIKMGFFEAYIGEITVVELERTSNISLKSLFFDLIRDFGVEVVRLDKQKREEVEFLTKRYLEEGVIPSDKIDDGIHIATMVVEPWLEVLVTWNCQHIANINIERRLKAITLENGYEFNFKIATPEEVIFYGN